MKPTQITKMFDVFLGAKGLRFEVVIIGGSALALQGVIDCETVDVDCLALKPAHPEIDDAYVWVSRQDANTHWPDHVRAQFLRLKKALGYV